MKKKNRSNKKGLKKRLSAVMLIYMDNLDHKKKARLDKHLDKKLNPIVDYYFNLFNKKKRKRIFISPLVDKNDLVKNKKEERVIMVASEENIDEGGSVTDSTFEQNISL